MSHKDNGDTRSTGEGGWFYAENELFSVFAPLIGADGVAVYMAMCRLIPLAAVDPDRQVTTRSVSEASTVSRSQANRKMAEIVRLGMVEEIRQAKNRPSAYKLLALRELSLVGIVELQRRLGVPQGDTKPSPQSSTADTDTRFMASQTGVGGVINNLSAAAERFELVTPPAASGEAGVPPRDTTTKHEQNEPVSQKTASVSQKTASVSQKQASVSQNRGPYKEEEKEEEEDKSPPTPLQGEVGLSVSPSRVPDLVLPDPDCRPGEPSFPINVGHAARWVLRRCGISNSRMERPVISAFSLRMTQNETDRLPEIAALAAENFLAYQDADERGLLRFRVGLQNFFHEQGYWHSRKSWAMKDPEPRPTPPSASATRSPEELAAREREDEEGRKAAIDYWRSMRAKGLAIYDREAPRWVKKILEAEEPS